MPFHNKRFIFLFTSFKTDGRVSFHLDRFVLSSLAVVFKKAQKTTSFGVKLRICVAFESKLRHMVSFVSCW